MNIARYNAGACSSNSIDGTTMQVVTQNSGLPADPRILAGLEQHQPGFFKLELVG